MIKQKGNHLSITIKLTNIILNPMKSMIKHTQLLTFKMSLNESNNSKITLTSINVLNLSLYIYIYVITVRVSDAVVRRQKKINLGK